MFSGKIAKAMIRFVKAPMQVLLGNMMKLKKNDLGLVQIIVDFIKYCIHSILQEISLFSSDEAQR